MYIQKTKFYCPRCRTHDHWGDEVCPKANGETPLDQPVIPVAASVPNAAGVDRAERRPIKQAQEFIKRGRPKVYPDRKTQMRELMRRRRAKTNPG